MKKGMCFGLVMTLLVILKPSYTNSDNLALLASTLKTMQRAACDDEMVALACPKGTSISIQVAQYGKAAPQGHGCMADSLSEGPSDTKCMWPNSMQYSLLQTVVEACQKKPQCKFSTKPKPGLVDPCPLSRKFVEVAFKCRPYEFRSRTGCENEVIRLSCNPFSRIAIFDAQFGRRAYESIACPRQGAEESESIACLAPYAAETVMQICHGKRRCQIVASSKTFGNNCKSASYLKVIYACVPLGVLTERYESAAEKDEISNSKPNLNQDLFDEAEEDSGERWSETNVPPIADPALEQPQEVQTVTEGPASTVARPHSTKEADPSTSEDTSKSANTIMYITIGLVILVCLVTLLFIGFYLYMHRSSEDSKTGDMFTTEAPNVFNDAVSDIDNDIDVSHISGTFCGDVNPDMILYRDVPGSKGTIRAMKPLSTVYPSGVSMYGSDFVPSSSRTIDTSRYSRCKENVEIDSEVMVSPKSLRGYSNTEFYYG